MSLYLPLILVCTHYALNVDSVGSQPGSKDLTFEDVNSSVFASPKNGNVSPQELIKKGDSYVNRDVSQHKPASQLLNHKTDSILTSGIVLVNDTHSFMVGEQVYFIGDLSTIIDIYSSTSPRKVAVRVHESGLIINTTLTEADRESLEAANRIRSRTANEWYIEIKSRNGTGGESKDDYPELDRNDGLFHPKLIGSAVCIAILGVGAYYVFWN